MLLTVFTPTYNRRELLGRVYQSLLAQTDLNFIWLIVDDGSTDDTGTLVQEWVREERITIEYLYRENGGKMRAHNTGVVNCRTRLFICLDSDDYFPEYAVELVTATWRQIEDDSSQDTEKVCGIVAHKGRSATEILTGGEFADVKYTTLQGLYRKGFSGETTLVFRTDILKRFPFPEIDGEKYVPEDYIYDRIDKEYVLRVLPRILTICELVTSGYTDSVEQLRDENPQAWLLYYQQRAQDAPMSLLKLKYISHYMQFARAVGKPVFRGERILPVSILLLGLPGYVLLRLRHKK